MALTIGTQLGSHGIVALLCKGGMGEVYRARDKKLKREVAIKVLPDEFSHSGHPTIARSPFSAAAANAFTSPSRPCQVPMAEDGPSVTVNG
jgi:eukaryotic-like serine/threonine-protein kinase